MNHFFLKIKIEKGAQSGFSLVETLVSLAILMTAVLGPMSIAQSGIQGARIASQNITAIFLAQEAIEMVKAQVYSAETNGNSDKNPLNGSTNNPNYWLTNVRDCENGTNGCAVDASTGAPTPIAKCSGSGTNPCPPLYINGNGFYTTTDTDSSHTFSGSSSAKNEITPYTRQVIIGATGNLDERLITVTVNWYQPDGVTLRGTYTANDYIFQSPTM
ncbi:MAG: prepilin-type N-terminal cleavage/methylation domain-containing protein [Minisyncoccota bacterium]